MLRHLPLLPLLIGLACVAGAWGWLGSGPFVLDWAAARDGHGQAVGHPALRLHPGVWGLLCAAVVSAVVALAAGQARVGRWLAPAVLLAAVAGAVVAWLYCDWWPTVCRCHYELLGGMG